MLSPLLTIGITTYNRNKLLRECLVELTKNKNFSFEILIGNDYQKVPLSEELLDIHDERIKIINYPINVGPIGNSSELLKTATGKYFTWLSDDDLLFTDGIDYILEFLEKNQVNCLFAPYIDGKLPPQNYKIEKKEIIYFNTNVLLEKYLAKELKIIGCYGLYNTYYLKSLGGMETLGNSFFSPCSDNLLFLKNMTKDKIYFTSAPLNFFRIHDESPSAKRSDPILFGHAMLSYLQKCHQIFSELKDVNDVKVFHYLLFISVLNDFFTVASRSNKLHLTSICNFLWNTRQQFKYAKNFQFKLFANIVKNLKLHFKILIKSRLINITG